MASSLPSAATRLGVGICAPLAREKINLTFLTHVPGSEGQHSNTVFCTDLQAGASSHLLVRTHHGNQGVFHLYPGTCIITLYPHDKRPEIAGYFLRSLARAKTIIHGLASSPAAISGVLSLTAKDRAIQQLFRQFQFPTHRSPAEFYAAQPPPEELVRAVVAAYQEKVVKIYCLVRETDLTLGEVSIPSVRALADFGAALVALGEQGLRLYFLVALPALAKRELRFAICLRAANAARNGSAELNQVMHSRLPGSIARQQNPVAAIFIHGPHFGDRYGIAHTLVEALEKAGIALLALSCTVSSISVIINQQDLAPAVQLLEKTFAVSGSTPVPCRPARTRP